MTTKKCLAVLIVMVVFGAKIFSQEEKTAQVSFIYPISTSGTNSTNYSNKLSFNTIAGINGGVNGFELGSVLNINKGAVIGLQIAGVSNLTNNNSKGTIISGVANKTNNDSKGTMISGVVNSSESHQGLQLSALNIVKERLKGIQLGAINIAKEVKGTQLGLINIANNGDEIVPIGIINAIKGGYYALELSTNELLFSNITFKMGVEKFHTLLRGGIGSYNGESVLGVGMGFGSIIPIKNNHKLNIELICDDIMYDYKMEGINLLNQLNIHYQYQITNFLAVKAGPGIRSYVTDQKVNGEFNTLDIPYTILESTGDKIKTSSWVGFNAGVIISL
jgi:hypothetical protein